MKKTSRTRPLKWAFIMFILMSVTKLTSYAQEEKPNIIYILSDDQAWNDYGFTGHPHIETLVFILINMGSPGMIQNLILRVSDTAMIGKSPGLDFIKTI